MARIDSTGFGESERVPIEVEIEIPNPVPNVIDLCIDEGDFDLPNADVFTYTSDSDGFVNATTFNTYAGGEGSHALRYSYETDSCSLNKVLVINVYGYPPIQQGVGLVVCAGANTLDITQGASHGSWSALQTPPQTNPSTVNANHLSNGILQNIGSLPRGEYTFSLSVTNGFCIRERTRTVHIVADTTIEAGDDIIVNSDTLAYLDLTEEIPSRIELPSPYGGIWTFQGSDAIYNHLIEGNKIKIYQLPKKTYTLIYELVGCDDSDTMELHIVDDPINGCEAPGFLQDIGDPDNQNYVRTYSPKVPTTQTAQTVEQLGATPTGALVTTQYIDGLGRPYQTVSKMTSPNQKDRVQSLYYDGYSRQPRGFLPYEALAQDGKPKIEPLLEQKDFYENPPPKVAATCYPYTLTEFEPSPLNRVVGQAAPGESWVATVEHGFPQDEQRKVSTTYRSNIPNDAVIYWRVINDQLQFSTYYKSANESTNTKGELSVVSTEDENKHSTWEFTNKQGQVVLKKVEDENALLQTYYVYDDYDNLRFVIPPKAVELLLSNGFTISEEVKDLLFYYHYDVRRRLVVKKVPSTGNPNHVQNTDEAQSLRQGEVHMVYDKRDRLVFTQDAQQRLSNQWLYTLYDELNRPTETGLVVYSENRATLQAAVDYGMIDLPLTGITFDNPPQPIEDELPKDVVAGENLSFDAPVGSKRHVATQSIVLSSGFRFKAQGDVHFTGELWHGTNNQIIEAENSTVNYTPNEAGYVSGGTVTLSTGFNFKAINKKDFTVVNDPTRKQTTVPPPANPLVSTGRTPLTYSHYDSYDTDENGTADFQYNASYNTLIGLPSNFTNFAKVKGQITVTEVKILGTANDWLQTATFYDQRGRVIQTQADNHLGGTDIMTSRYDFVGRVQQTYLHHQNPTGTDQRIVKTYHYDHAGRLLKVEEKINQQATEVLAQHEYNAIGELVQKQVANQHETVEYRYNIRGWLTRINEADLSLGALFGMELAYEKPEDANVLPQFNGNISELSWGVATSATQRRYTYEYDPLNRLTKANYFYNQNGWNAGDANEDFTVSHIRYDANGNITALERKGLIAPQQYGTVDALTYSYQGNRLKAVEDAQGMAGTANDFKNGAATSNEYHYDYNGNLNRDDNKGITQIEYNHLNLPKTVHFEGDNRIAYTYDAAGIKLSKHVFTNNALTGSTDYVGEFHYQDQSLQFIHTEEGRALANGNNFDYEYHYKDHLGNLRLSFKPGNNWLMDAEQNSSFFVYDENYRNSQQSHTGGWSLKVNTNGVVYSGIIPVQAGKVYSTKVAFKYDTPQGGGGSNAREGVEQHFNLNAPLLSTENVLTPEGLQFNQVKVNLLSLGTLLGKAVGKKETKPQTKPVKATRQLTSTGAYLKVRVYNTTNTSLSASPIITKELLLEVANEWDSAGFVIDIDKLAEEYSVTVGTNWYIRVSIENDDSNFVRFDDWKISESEVKQVNSYYPFGMNMTGIEKQGQPDHKFQYNGMSEKEESFGLNWYETPFRSYDNQLGRWHQIDPKASERESPFVGMANNPIRYNDILGDTIRDNNNIVSNYRTYLNDRIKGLQTMLDTDGFDFTKYGTSKQAVQGLVANLKGVNSELDELKASEQVYNVSFDGSLPSGAGGVSFNSETGAVEVAIGQNSDFSKIAGVVSQELLHAYQFETGEVSIAADNSFYGSLYDIGDETATYKREHLVVGGISSGSYINDEWTRKQGASMTPPAYQSLPDGPINLKSTQGILLWSRTLRQGALGRPITEVFKGWQKYVKPIKRN